MRAYRIVVEEERARIHAWVMLMQDRYERCVEAGNARGARDAFLGLIDADRDLFQLGWATNEKIFRRGTEYLYEFKPGRLYPIFELIPGA